MSQTQETEILNLFINKSIYHGKTVSFYIQDLNSLKWKKIFQADKLMI